MTDKEIIEQIGKEAEQEEDYGHTRKVEKWN